MSIQVQDEARINELTDFCPPPGFDASTSIVLGSRAAESKNLLQCYHTTKLAMDEPPVVGTGEEVHPQLGTSS